ncbi:MAG: hypothetical protein AB7G44_04355 [Bacteroidia bacterium]
MIVVKTAKEYRALKGIDKVIYKYQEKLAHYKWHQKNTNTTATFNFLEEICLCRSVLKDLNKLKKQQSPQTINK